MKSAHVCSRKQFIFELDISPSSVSENVNLQIIVETAEEFAKLKKKILTVKLYNVSEV